jgi:hypothetical protein
MYRSVKCLNGFLRTGCRQRTNLIDSRRKLVQRSQRSGIAFRVAAVLAKGFLGGGKGRQRGPAAPPRKPPTPDATEASRAANALTPRILPPSVRGRRTGTYLCGLSATGTNMHKNWPHDTQSLVAGPADKYALPGISERPAGITFSKTPLHCSARSKHMHRSGKRQGRGARRGGISDVAQRLHGAEVSACQSPSLMKGVAHSACIICTPLQILGDHQFPRSRQSAVLPSTLPPTYQYRRIVPTD